MSKFKVGDVVILNSDKMIPNKRYLTVIEDYDNFVKLLGFNSNGDGIEITLPDDCISLVEIERKTVVPPR